MDEHPTHTTDPDTTVAVPAEGGGVGGDCPNSEDVRQRDRREEVKSNSTAA